MLWNPKQKSLNGQVDDRISIESRCCVADMLAKVKFVSFLQRAAVQQTENLDIELLIVRKKEEE